MRQKLNALIGFTKQKTKLLSGLIIGLVIGAGGAIALASIPDSSGVIHSCYRNTALQKTFRVIDSATTSCNANETALNWNQQGPQGIQGPAGPTGPTGPQGPAGTGNGSENTAGRYLVLNWGDIPAEGTPQALYTVPGFGDVSVTQCDEDGNTNFAFHNTSGQTLYYWSNGLSVTLSIVPDETISYDDGTNFPNSTVSFGNGSSSRVALIAVEAHVSPSQQTCTFFGGAI